MCSGGVSDSSDCNCWGSDFVEWYFKFLFVIFVDYMCIVWFDGCDLSI